MSRHSAWLAIGVLVSFLVPFVLADQIGIQDDVYYGLYAAAVVGLFLAWARDTGQSVDEMVSRHWKWALGLGLLFAAVSVLIVLGTEDSTSRPGGAEFIGALVWRGLLYGATDGLLLSAFPILVVFAALAESRLRSRRGGVVAVGAIALAASLLITATITSATATSDPRSCANPSPGISFGAFPPW